eukprot:548180-Prymnesium_polylepis.1
MAKRAATQMGTSENTPPTALPVTTTVRFRSPSQSPCPHRSRCPVWSMLLRYVLRRLVGAEVHAACLCALRPWVVVCVSLDAAFPIIRYSRKIHRR